MAEEIADNLFDISQMIKSLIDDNKEEISKTDVPYSRLNVDEFNYEVIIENKSQKTTDEEPTLEDRETAVAFSEEEITKVEWDRQDKEDYILDEIFGNEEYQRIISIIEDRFSGERESAIHTDPNPHYLLYNFIDAVTDLYLEQGEIEQKAIVNLISSFTSEIERPPIEWKPNIFIDGLGLENESIEVSDNITLRRSTADDIEVDIRLESAWFGHSYSPLSSSTPSGVIEYQTRAKNEMELLDKIEEIISCFHLFRVGSVTRIGQEPNPSSPLRHSSRFWEGERIETPFFYTLTQENSEALSDFFDIIRPKLNEQILSTESENYLTIAYNRYENALMDDSSPESRLVSAIMALEALYLSENEEGELSERLAQRTGLLISLFDNPPIKVYNRVKKAYNIRSNYVHGSKIQEEDRKGLLTLEERIANYTRKSLVLHLQSRAYWNKSELLSKVDNAILDTSARADFEEELLEALEYPKIK